MAQITIDLKEYNSYKETIDHLQKENFVFKKKIGEKRDEIEDLKEKIEIVKHANFIDRVFAWKQIIKLISSVN